MAFNLFGRKGNDPEDKKIFMDRTYISSAAKMNACVELAKKEPDHLFIAWFSETAKIFKSYFLQQGLDETRITEARYVHTTMLQHKTPVFVEHYPLHAKELELIKNWDAEQIIVFSAMDEPLFKHFGSEKLLPLMKMLGMKENEVIEHSMVSKSILSGQEKIAAQVSLEQSANSQADWMEKNIKS